MKALTDKNYLYNIIFILFIAITILVILLPLGPIWITDNGNKYMIMRNFIASGSCSFVPDVVELFPNGGFHFVQIGNIFKSFYTEHLPIITAYLYQLFGDFACSIPSIISSFLVVIFCFYYYPKYCRNLLTILVIFTTPLLFYSTLLWEMLPSCAFAIAGVLLLKKEKYFLCGLTLGLGLWLREELYFLYGAIFLALLFTKQTKGAFLSTLGFILVATSLWTKEFLVNGNILGIHGANYLFNNRTEEFNLISELLGIISNYNQHLIRFDVGGRFFNYITIGVIIFSFILGTFKESKKFLKVKIFTIFIASLMHLYLAIKLFTYPSLSYATGVTMGLFTSIPTIYGFLLNWRNLITCKKKFIKVTSIYCFIYILVVPAFLTRFDIGLTWGPRHFMVILPQLLLLSYFSFASMNILSQKRKLLSLSILAAVIMQLFSLYALYFVAHESNALEKLVEQRKEKVIVSDIFFLPEQAPRIFFTKKFYEVRNAKEITSLIETLKRDKESEFLLILSQQFRKINNQDLKTLLTIAPPSCEPEWFDVNGSGFMRLALTNCKLKRK